MSGKKEVFFNNLSLEQVWKGVLDADKTLSVLSSSDTAPAAELDGTEVGWGSTP